MVASRLSIVVSLTMAGCCVPAVALAAAAADSTASFSVASPTEVPGALLKPGAYTIQLLDHLSDRTIVRLDSATGSTHVTFLGVNAASGSNDAAHPVEWPEKTEGHHALRGFVFPGGKNVEFVYPKAAAVSLANANSSGVVAIDPASEGRPELSKLTSEDMTMVNLWMLTPVRVGPGQGKKGIEAKRYATVVATSAPVAPTAQVASTPAPAAMSPGMTARVTPPSRTVARLEPPAPPVARSLQNRAAVHQLPKTASTLPLVWLGVALSFAGAGVLRARRAWQA